MALRNGLLLALSFCVLGCGRGTPPTTGVEAPHSTTVVDSNSIVTATLAATEFVTAAKAGTASANMLTDDFKKVIGEPITPAEREKGFSDTAAVDWLKVVGPRLKSGQLSKLLVSEDIACFGADQGLVRIVKQNQKWHIDWLHAGRESGLPPINSMNYENTAVSFEIISKRFAVASFLDPLFTNNYELSEAALTLDAKKSLAPPLGGDARGYNRGTLRGKLKSILNGATSYTVAMTGDKASVTLTGSAEKKLTLTLSAGARPEIWIVNGLD
jgi:hypothetical protein